MKKYQKVAINIAFLTIVFSAGMVSNFNFVSAPSNERNSKYSQEKQEKILNTFENSDYLAWKKIIGQNNKVGNLIDEPTFKDFIAARIAARNGEYNKALKITDNLRKKIEPRLITVI